MKKIGLLLLLLFVIFGFGVSFANPIALPTYCYAIKNVEIDNYRVIIEYGKRGLDSEWGGVSLDFTDKREVYEPKPKECTKCSRGGESRVYLLDKSIDTKDVTMENIDSEAIFIGDIGNSDCTSYYDTKIIYKVEESGGMYLLARDKAKNMDKVRELEGDLVEFPVVRFLTILLETIILFFIAKIFWRDEGISNKRLILFGIIPTTITLPFLYFLFPLVLGDGMLYMIVGELFVVMIESIIIKYGLKISRKKAIIASVICNLFSFIILSDSYDISDLRDGFFIPRFLVALIELIVLLVAWKLVRDAQFTRNKLIIVGIITSTVTMLFLNIAIGLNPEDFDLWSRCCVLLMRICIQSLILKYWLKISWRDAIIASFVCNLLSYLVLNIIDLPLKMRYNNIRYPGIPSLVVAFLGL